MNGAESLIATALAGHVDVCFANPGTTEMPLVQALDGEPGMRPVLTLFEGVATGAADGYARMAERPAMTLLHLGPGTANGLANLHNARRAHSPLLNVVGDHASWHLAWDAPLTSDIDSLVRPVSGWVRSSDSADALAGDVAAALAAARSAPGQVATLIVPADAQWGVVDESVGHLPGGAARPVAPAVVGEERVTAAAAALRNATPGVLLLGGAALTEAGVRAAGRVAAATGCRLLTEKFPARAERGAGLPVVDKLPYFPEPAREALTGVGAVVLAGAPSPVAFFGYPGVPSSEVPEGTTAVPLAAPGDDVIAALCALADEVGTAKPAPGPSCGSPEVPTGALNARSLCQAIAALQPEGAIVVEEALSSAGAYFPASANAPRHTVLSLTGGAIGQGLPSAAGAAIACPDRSVIAFQADGSGLYTAQALWTMAREQLDVTVVVAANGTYRILQTELARAGVTEPGHASRSLTDLGSPRVDWVALGTGYGVPARRVENADDLVGALAEGLREPGPHLVEAML